MAKHSWVNSSIPLGTWGSAGAAVKQKSHKARHGSEPLPAVAWGAKPLYRLLANLIFPGDLGDRTAIGFPQDRNHLLFGKTAFLHGLPLGAGAIRSSLSQK